jgi:hypothetical protein
MRELESIIYQMKTDLKHFCQNFSKSLLLCSHYHNSTFPHSAIKNLKNDLQHICYSRVCLLYFQKKFCHTLLIKAAIALAVILLCLCIFSTKLSKIIQMAKSSTLTSGYLRGRKKIMILNL